MANITLDFREGLTILNLNQAKNMPIVNPNMIETISPVVITDSHISESLPRAISMVVADSRLPIERVK